MRVSISELAEASPGRRRPSFPTRAVPTVLESGAWMSAKLQLENTGALGVQSGGVRLVYNLPRRVSGMSICRSCSPAVFPQTLHCRSPHSPAGAREVF